MFRHIRNTNDFGEQIMVKGILAASVVVASIVSAVYVGSPSFRSALDSQTRKLSAWSEAERQADPIGFVKHVEAKLGTDLNALKSVRQSLSFEASKLAEQRRTQEALLRQSNELAAEFRAAYQSGKDSATIRRCAYTREGMRTQVGSILAEVATYRSNIVRISEVQELANERLKELNTQVEETRAEIAALGTRRELLRSRKFTDEANQLVAAVDALFETNRHVIETNPVRSVRELLAEAERSNREVRSDDREVTEYLAESRTETTALVQPTEAIEHQHSAGRAANRQRNGFVQQSDTFVGQETPVDLENIEVVTKRKKQVGPADPQQTFQQDVPKAPTK